MDMNVFYALAILVLADTYRTLRQQLRLPRCPSGADLRQRMKGFLGDSMGLLEFLAATEVKLDADLGGSVD
jgi:hypothetical protein